MQFVKDGPDIPERLLQAHEDGRVVFFCGAGISYPAGLPGFSGLVERLFDVLGESPNDIHEAAIKSGQYDTAIGLLESDIVGERETVRPALAEILKPDLRPKNATKTHESLLTLGRCRNGRTRLVTTNFDRLFEAVIASKGLTVDRFSAPLLPVPKNRWDGLVYLHGLLSETPSPSDLDRLVVSSGDFGLAYLTERWAARISADLARLCVSAGDAFPEAFAMLRAWLQPQEHPEYLVHTFAIARLARKHPEQALDFLDLVMGELNQWPPSDLGNCLQQIRDAAPALEADERFQRLSAYLRQHGQEF